MTSTYRKGADKGPQAIIEASAQVEWYDIETGTEPHLHGIHTQQPVECSDPDPIHLSPFVRDRVRGVLQSGKLPVVLGGEHSVSIGAIEAAAEIYEDLTVVQIDAHGDTRDTYHGSTHNHACVMARAKELAATVQIGIRAIDKQEKDNLEPERTFFAHDIHEMKSDQWMDSVTELLTEHVYLTVDIDAFDPSIIPATGTPEPDGLDWRTVNTLIKHIVSHSKIVCFDVVELCPHEAHHASNFIAAKLIVRIIAECISSSRGYV